MLKVAAPANPSSLDPITGGSGMDQTFLWILYDTLADWDYETLKPKPGVYRMCDTRGDVLYVGKARALKNRVANYTQVERLPLRLQRMVAQTRGMEIVTTNSEAEALLLERS